MALPAFVAVSALSSGAGAIEPHWPSHSTDDIGILLVQTSNEVVSFTTAHTFSEISDSPQGVGTGGAAAATRLSAYWARATSASMPTPVIADPGDHALAIILTFSGCATSGLPWNVTAPSTSALTTAMVLAGDTTTVDDCLILGVIAGGADVASSAAYSGWANAALANIAERFDQHVSSANGGGFGVFTGEKATAGAFGDTTATVAGTQNAANLVIALRPEAAASASAAVTGTAGDGATESQIVNGGQTIVITLTDDTWVAEGATFNAQRAAILAGLDAASSPATGWNNKVRDTEDVTAVVRTSDTVATITLSAAPDYAISANETITVTVPAAAVAGGEAIVATPTFDITNEAAAAASGMVRPGVEFIKAPLTFIRKYGTD